VSQGATASPRECNKRRATGLVVVGGVLSAGSDETALAEFLAVEFTVHVMERRGRPGSGPQRQDHSLDDECVDLAAVAAATGAAAAFGHSFGGLVVLETTRRQPVFHEVFVYEPGVPILGQLQAGWLDDYQRRLEHGDRRGAFASMVKGTGFAPRAVAIMPACDLRWVLRIAVRGQKGATMDRLLEANLVEHRLQAELDAPSHLGRGPPRWAHRLPSPRLLDPLAGTTVAITG
jgi:pimeloyl-ACP methyl ester carboxylesterase